MLADAVERRASEAEIADISAARGRLVAQAIDAEDRARRGISEALHDGALQELLVARNQLLAMAGHGGDEAALAAAQARLAGILTRLREVMSALHPTLLHYGGLATALQAVAEQERGTAGVRAARRSRRRRRPACATSWCSRSPASCWPTRRAMRARRGSRSACAASRARRADRRRRRLRVSRSGRLEAALARGAIGVASCRERVEALGGTLLMSSAPGAGTRAVARIPLDPGSTGRRWGRDLPS